MNNKMKNIKEEVNFEKAINSDILCAIFILLAN